MTQFNDQYSSYNNTNDKAFRSYMSKTMLTVALGLGISAIFAYLFTANFERIYTMLGTFYTWFMLIVIVGELGIAITFGAKLMTLSKQGAWGLFIGYAALTGISLSTIIMRYTTSSVFMAFATTGVLFICMAIIGLTTNVDLTRFSSLILSGLIGIIFITFLNNLFFHSPWTTMIICYVSIVLFLGLIAFDTQSLKMMYQQSFADAELFEKLMIFGALRLYLDFINLFIRILQLFGRRD